MSGVKTYLEQLTRAVSRGWDRFWFTPRDAAVLGPMRVLVGVAALYFVLSHTQDLERWFGADGMLPRDTATTLNEEFDWDSRGGPYHLSYFYWADDALSLWVLHGLGVLAVALFTLGLATRVTSVLALVVVLSYVHRAPLLAGQMEPVLAMLLFYLAWSPCGASWSLDRALRLPEYLQGYFRLPGVNDQPPDRRNRRQSWSANVCWRLMQLHLAGFVLLMALCKVSSLSWWAFEVPAIWWLIARAESRLFDLTGLAPYPYALEFATQAAVAFELAFPVLIWNRWARPLLVTLAVPIWLGLGLLTGMLGFFGVLLIGCCVFLPENVLLGRDAPPAAADAKPGGPKTTRKPTVAEQLGIGVGDE